MDCTRLDYYLNKVDINDVDKQFISEFDDLIENKNQKNLKLQSLADSVTIAGKIVKVVNLTSYLSKITTLNFFEMYEEVITLSLEDTELTFSNDLFLSSLLDEMSTLIDGIDLAVDAVEAISTFGISLATTYIAKKTSDMINEEKEVILKKLESDTRLKREILTVLSKEKNHLVRQHKLSLLIKNVNLNQVF